MILRTSLILCILLVSVYSCERTPIASNAKEDASWEKLKDRIEYHLAGNPDSAYHYIIEARKRMAGKPSLPSGKILINSSLGRYFLRTHQLDSAQHYFHEAIQIAKPKRFINNRNKLTAHLAYVHNLKKNYDSAIYYYNRAINYFKKQNDTIALATTLSSQASVLIDQRKFKQALEVLYQAEKYLQKTDKHLNLGAVYENIAAINVELGHDSLNPAYYQKAINTYRQIDDPSHLAGAYGSMGLYFKSKNMYDSALTYYNRVAEIASQTDNQHLKAQNLLNKGNLHDITGNTKKALNCYNRSLAICQHQNIVYGTYLNYINLGELNLKTDKPQRSASFLSKAYQLQKDYGFHYSDKVLFNLHKAEKALGNTRRSLTYLEQYCYYRDSVNKHEKHKELMELQTRFETQKKEAQILQLKQQKHRSELMRAYLLIALIGLVLVAVGILFWSYRKRASARQQHLKLEKENQQRRDQMEKLNLEKKLQKEAAERYQLDLQLKEQELVYQTLKQAGISHINQSVKEKLSPFTHRLARKKDQEQFSKALQEIEQDVRQEPLSDFEEMFRQMHGDFYEKLLDINNDLSRSELQLCALLRMNLPSKEIANLLNLAISTIDQRRHSIRKKLNLDNNQNLTSYLISL